MVDYTVTGMSEAMTLLKTTFSQLNVFGVDWFASIILIFLTILIITRKTEVMQYLALSVTMAWSAAGLEVPLLWYFFAVIMFTLQLLTSRIIQDSVANSLAVWRRADEKTADIKSDVISGKFRNSRTLLGFGKSLNQVTADNSIKQLKMTEKQRIAQSRDRGKLEAIGKNAAEYYNDPESISFEKRKKDNNLLSSVELKLLQDADPTLYKKYIKAESTENKSFAKKTKRQNKELKQQQKAESKRLKDETRFERQAMNTMIDNAFDNKTSLTKGQIAASKNRNDNTLSGLTQKQINKLLNDSGVRSGSGNMINIKGLERYGKRKTNNNPELVVNNPFKGMFLDMEEEKRKQAFKRRLK